jgi:hypothetical protein
MISVSDVRRRRKLSTASISVRQLATLCDGTAPSPIDVCVLLRRLYGFNPQLHGYHFRNHWEPEGNEAQDVLDRLQARLDAAMDMLKPAILDPLGTLVVPLVDEDITGPVADAILALVRDGIMARLLQKAWPESYGMCGGMAFSALDFYFTGRPVRSWFAAEPDAPWEFSQEDLRPYIWRRLLDSLDANGATFIVWLALFYIVPEVLKSHLHDIVATISAQVVKDHLSAFSGAGIPVVGGYGGGFRGLVSDVLSSPKKLVDRIFGSSDSPGNRALKLLDHWVDSMVEIILPQFDGARDLLARTVQEWGKCKNLLDSCQPCPIGLIYGDSMVPTRQHQVVAIDYAEDNNGRGTLVLWDNNDPDQESVWTLDFLVAGLQGTNPLDNRPLVGFFCEDYTQEQPPSDLKHSTIP